MTEQGLFNSHERYKELAALANSGTLSPVEWNQLRCHLKVCGECRDVFGQFMSLVSEGMPMLVTRYGTQDDNGIWDDTRLQKNLFAQIQALEECCSSGLGHKTPIAGQSIFVKRVPPGLLPLAQTALAACALVVVGFAGYRLGDRASAGAHRVQVTAINPSNKVAPGTKDAEEAPVELLPVLSQEIAQLQEEASRRSKELSKLRLAMHTIENRAKELDAAKSTMEEQSRTYSQQRDALSGQLRDAQVAYQNAQAELAKLREEYDAASLHAVSLQSKIDDLMAVNRDNEQRLKTDEQYLASDRDIRELMGARNLYISDVFDVDSHSRTQKPYGRVFYTQGKSLIFYAFDLDREKSLKIPRAFQAWGLKEPEQKKPLNLGILYMDNESKRRWVLRVDDPDQLANMDAVFVTVEPRGGSQVPTGKPFLYAQLRKEANHP